eukprot:TRINITY_DN9920_c1_g1_i1.p1 TRINITY_DN9920_c1_g1~~TRINITY_DN9920_c1_g1_i1.p1  ORF type:complete len:185 (+),score=-3.95 TRINITY_DN9920_c1_g1_i1:526-1080(+)
MYPHKIQSVLNTQTQLAPLSVSTFYCEIIKFRIHTSTRLQKQQTQRNIMQVPQQSSASKQLKVLIELKIQNKHHNNQAKYSGVSLQTNLGHPKKILLQHIFQGRDLIFATDFITTQNIVQRYLYNLDNFGTTKSGQQQNFQMDIGIKKDPEQTIFCIYEGIGYTKYRGHTLQRLYPFPKSWHID